MLDLQQQSRQNPELAEQLKKLAEEGCSGGFGGNEGQSCSYADDTPGNALAGIVTRDDESIFITMLDVMYCVEPPVSQLQKYGLPFWKRLVATTVGTQLPGCPVGK